MNYYQQSAPGIWNVETPFNEDVEVDWWSEEDQFPIIASDATWQRMLLILFFVAVMVTLFARLALPAMRANAIAEAPEVAATGNSVAAVEAAAVPGTGGVISAVFSPEVQYWAPQIAGWAAQHDLDPNIVATIMQIESCGDPQALSRAGAQGLFQVMPFHFATGENMMDPDTNARRGMAYFVERMKQTGGDIGRAFAGYNGGHVAAGTTWDNWAHETQRYYVWSTGIYGEATAGLSESPTLQRWMEAGGAGLCRQAAARLGLN